MQGDQAILLASDLLLPDSNGANFETSKKYPLDVLLEKDPEICR